MRKWLLLIVIAMISVIVLAACGGGNNDNNANNANNANENNNAEENNNAANNNEESEEADSDETFVIGASQFVEHASLDAAYEGFKEAIADAGLNEEYDCQNDKEEQNNIKTNSKSTVTVNCC